MKIRLYLIGSIFVIFSLLFVSSVSASTIEELQAKITELQSAGSSLTKQITLLNSQITLTTLKLEIAKTKIDTLENEISELNNTIEQLEKDKTRRLELALHRIPETYKRKRVFDLAQVILSSNFSELVRRSEYLLNLREQDTKIYKNLEKSQQSYNEQKDKREKKKSEQTELKKQQEQHARELAQQKQTKQALLDQTKNSEVVYQRLLAQALAEKQAFDRALQEGVNIGPVKKGDPIALVGNTGYPSCSTGAHLHFEVTKNGSWIDPGSKLSNKTIQDEQNGGTFTIGDGPWSWPLVDIIRLTQHFGKTPYSWRYSYSGGIHTGFDMVSSGSEVIRAPADGELFSSSQGCGSSIIKIKYIKHDDGVVSSYLHVQ